MSREPVKIEHAPPRPYSKAVVFGDLVFVSGEDCRDPRTLEFRGTTAAEQARHTFENLAATLREAGSSLASLLKTTVYLRDPEDIGAYLKVRGELLPSPGSPASTLIMGVKLADPRMLIEIEAISAIIRPE